MQPCPVSGCPKSVPDHRVMCNQHRRRLPKVLYDEVCRTYPDRERGAAEAHAYAIAVSAAVAAINAHQAEWTKTHA